MIKTITIMITRICVFKCIDNDILYYYHQYYWDFYHYYYHYPFHPVFILLLIIIIIIVMISSYFIRIIPITVITTIVIIIIVIIAVSDLDVSDVKIRKKIQTINPQQLNSYMPQPMSIPGPLLRVTGTFKNNREREKTTDLKAVKPKHT